MRETTRLLVSEHPHADKASYRKVLIETSLVSFVVTATPLLFAFRTFSCQNYYDHNPPFEGVGDRCALKEIETRAAQAVSVMVLGATIAGVLNLLLTTWIIKHWGVRSALTMQTTWSAVRNVFQIIGIYEGHSRGIQIICAAQVLTILGGGPGYMLSANTYIAEVVAPEETTAAFATLQGISLLATSIGFTVGGSLGDHYGTPLPSIITLVLLTISTSLSRFFLPYIAPPPLHPEADKSFFAAFRSLKILLPSEREDGGKGKVWGLTLLAIGSFLGVEATAYVPVMLQMAATNLFQFRPTQNGYLMSITSLSRTVFLTIFFPKIIAKGRKLFSVPSLPPSLPPSRPVSMYKGAIPDDPVQYEPYLVWGLDEGYHNQEPLDLNVIMKPIDNKHGRAFDLTFLRCSMFADAVLTASVGFSSRGWHMLLAAAVIPLASGTAPAAKGCMMEMVRPEKKAEALSAIALVEFLAMITTVSVFGEIFAFLSEQGRPNHVFVLNGSVAFVAGLILLLVRFPPRVRLDPETPQLSRTSTPNYLFPNYGTSGSGSSTPVGPHSGTPALIDYGDY